MFCKIMLQFEMENIFETHVILCSLYDVGENMYSNTEK